MLHALRMVAILVLLAPPALAQTLDPAGLDDAQLVHLLTEGDGHPLKCGTPYVAELEARGLSLPSLAAAEGDTLEYLTPEGHFKVVYQAEGLAPVDPTDSDLSGFPDYVELVGRAFERSWSVEIDSLGFGAPDIGDERYIVSLFLRSTGVFGQTLLRPAAPGGTLIEVRYDMEPFCSGEADPETCEVNLLLATIAHEFKHAIQFAEGWSLFQLGGSWIELDATWIEDLVYDDSNDYYRYLTLGTTPFTFPDRSLATYNDYRYATWDHYLGEYYGQDLMNEFSTAVLARGFPQYAQHSYVDAVTGRGLDWVEVWRDYTAATYLTGRRAAPGSGLLEAADYPTAATVAVASLPQPELFLSLPDMAMRFYEFNSAASATTGRLEIVFEGVSAPGTWTLVAVFQNADRTLVIPVPLNEGLATFTPPHRLEDFDTVGVLVGNSRVPVSVPSNGSYRLTLGVNTVPAQATSVGGFKGRFRRGAGN